MFNTFIVEEKIQKYNIPQSTTLKCWFYYRTQNFNGIPIIQSESRTSPKEKSKNAKIFSNHNYF